MRNFIVSFLFFCFPLSCGNLSAQVAIPRRIVAIKMKKRTQRSIKESAKWCEKFSRCYVFYMPCIYVINTHTMCAHMCVCKRVCACVCLLFSGCCCSVLYLVSNECPAALCRQFLLINVASFKRANILLDGVADKQLKRAKEGGGEKERKGSGGNLNLKLTNPLDAPRSLLWLAIIAVNSRRQGELRLRLCLRLFASRIRDVAQGNRKTTQLTQCQQRC